MTILEQHSNTFVSPTYIHFASATSLFNFASMYGRGGTAAPVEASQPAAPSSWMDGMYIHKRRITILIGILPLPFWSNFFFSQHKSSIIRMNRSNGKLFVTHIHSICGSIMEKQKHDDTNIQHFETQYRDCCVRRWDKSWKQRQLPLRYLLIDRNDTQQNMMRFDRIIDWSG
jgi:hypothetical protein